MHNVKFCKFESEDLCDQEKSKKNRESTAIKDEKTLQNYAICSKIYGDNLCTFSKKTKDEMGECGSEKYRKKVWWLT